MIPAALRALAAGQGRIDVDVAGAPASLGDALEALWAACPGLRDRVLTERGELRPHVNIFIGTESSRWSGGLATPLADSVEVSILPAVSGG